MKVTLIEKPCESDWFEVSRRALITMGKKPARTPPVEWRQKILEARHSPIRRLMYSFLIEDIPSNTATHLCRHVHAQPYVGSLRNDRQTMMDGDAAPRNTPVDMILDVNAEELMTIANKRLCGQAAEKTREAVARMCTAVQAAEPELEWHKRLVPMCVYHGGVCHEMKPCERAKR